MNEKLLRAEADTYRTALIELWSRATSGDRKTIDKSEVNEIASRAIDRGNELFRRAKAAA